MTTFNERSNNGRYNGNKKFNRSRKESKCINLSKKFETFEDGYTEMLKFASELKTYGGDVALYDAVVGNILSYIHDNIPSDNTSRFPNSISFTINSEEVSLRTDAGLVFGWRTVYNFDAAKVNYIFRITFIDVSASRSQIIEQMKKDEWVVKDMLIRPKDTRPYYPPRENNEEDGFKSNYSRRSKYIDHSIGRKVAEAEPPKEEEKKEVIVETESKVEIKEEATPVQPEIELPKEDDPINEAIAEQLKDFSFDEESETTNTEAEEKPITPVAL